MRATITVKPVETSLPMELDGYEVNLDALRLHGRIRHQDVVKSARLVLPSGAVKTAGLVWILVEMERGRVVFPIALKDFHEYVRLPVLPLVTVGEQD